MDFINYHFEPPFYLSILYDTSNYLFYSIIILIIFFLKKVELKYTIVILIALSSPFLFNNHFFEWWNLPDQSKYLSRSIGFKENIFINNAHINYINLDVNLSSLIFSIFTKPYLETYKSIAFFNRFIFVLIIYYLYEKKKIDKFLFYFLLITPSFLIYSSVSLREILIIALYFLTINFYYKKEYVISFLFAILSFFIKDGLIFLLILFLMYDLVQKKIIKKNIIYIFFVLIFFTSFLFSDYGNSLLNYIDRRRVGFFLEEYGQYKNILAEESYISLFELPAIFVIISSFIDFILSPFKGNVGIISYILTLDTIIFTYIILKNISLDTDESKLFTIFIYLNIFLLLLIMNLIVFNEYTVHRYKVVALFIIFSWQKLKKIK